MKLMSCAVLPQSSGVSGLPLHPLLDSALLQACAEPQFHILHSFSLHQRVNSDYSQFEEGCAKLQE